MIKLIRPACPNPQRLQTDYAFPENKEALRKSTYGKCMYCESKITATEYGDVEHIKPKSKYPELTFDWNNLGFSCEKCNRTYKNDAYDEKFINPYEDNPNEFFDAIGGFIVSKDNNNRGCYSCEVLGLNRIELVERRSSEINSLKSVLDKIAQNSMNDIKNTLINEINDFMRNQSEYSFVKRKFVEDYCHKTGINLTVD